MAFSKSRMLVFVMSVFLMNKCLGELQLRLRGGLSPSEGRVEVQYRGVWGAVCDDYWELNDGHVACRSLGYRLGAESVSCCSRYGHSASGRIFLDDVNCQGHEDSLDQCKSEPLGTHDCDPMREAAGLVCRSETRNTPEIPVRLMDGADLTEGRVEVMYKREWGAICDDMWDMRDGHVVCRMLGFDSATSTSCCGKYGPSKSRRVWLDDVQCKGEEKSISECNKREWGSNNCNYHETAGVVCKRAKPTTVPKVKFRLEGGRSPNQGRLEVEYNGQWGGVCDDHWTLSNAHVVCRELGFERGLSVACCSKYGTSLSNRIWLDDVICDGNEESLASCSHRPWGRHNCDTLKEMVGLECVGATLLPTPPPTLAPCPNGLERTLDGSICTEPCAEGYERSVLGSSCVDVNECNNSARVACPYECINTVGSFTCVCPEGYEGDGQMCTVISIPGPGDPHVRLTNGPSPNEGTVEVFRDGQWATVCDDFWDLRDAHVVCRMLGYTHADRAYCCGRHRSNITRAIMLDDVQCRGDEESIFQCRTSEWGVHNCQPGQEEASVSCVHVASFPSTPPPTLYAPTDVEFRLTGGPSPNEGRVEMFYRGEWGAVCDDNWRLRNGHVICRYLGYQMGARSVSCCSRYAASASRKIWLDDVVCRGTEKSLLRCIHRLGSSNCNNFETAGVVCERPTTDPPTTTPIPTTEATTTRSLYYTLKRKSQTVRLMNFGDHRGMGHVEVLRNGVWGAICDEGWDINDGHVVCRSLGYREASFVSCCSKYGSTSTGRAWMRNVQCKGTEETLDQCPHQRVEGRHKCSRFTLAGVVCEMYGPTSAAPTPPPYVWVRLVNGNRREEGAVMVRLNNEWRYVCDDNWGLDEGHVVCRMLGYTHAVRTPCCNRYNAPEMESFWMDDVRCTGNETSISACRHRGWGEHDCRKSEIAGVQCFTGTTTVSPYQHQLTSSPRVVKFRLTGGSRESEGRVELFHRGEWGSVCDDNWRIRNGHVICRHLGYPRALSVSCCSEFGISPSRRIWLDDVICRGNEKSLMDCRHRELGLNNCNQWEIASVKCDPGSNTASPVFTTVPVTSTAPSFSTRAPVQRVRLVGGASPNEGRVEIYHNGEWGAVCDDFWNLLDGHVVCRMLGFPKAESVSCCSTYGSHWASKMLLDDVKCSGMESSLLDCSHKEIGQHDCHPGEETAGVHCQPFISSTTHRVSVPTTQPAVQVAVPVRLRGGRSAHEGRIEVYHEGVWGAVCDDGWRIPHGNVICRMLGYEKATAVTCCGAFVHDPPSNIWLDDVRCRGNERSIFRCAHRPWGINNCNMKELAGVVCHLVGATPSPPACGIKPSLPSTGFARAGPARPEDWPWQTMILNRRRFPFCSGVLISARHVITAAHCFDRIIRTDQIIVRLGAYIARSGRLDWGMGSRWEQEIAVAAIHKHPSYQAPTRWANDIAVLKLARPAILNKRVNVVCMENETNIFPGTPCWTTGWGLLGVLPGDMRIIQQISVPIVSFRTCQKNYPSIHRSMTCAGYDDGRGVSCSGDSGSPLVCQSAGQWHLIGVSSWDGGCGWPRFYGVYTTASYFASWLTSRTSS
ncbi:deleted in malignant brain tumors 1 protein [Nematostella vectensis]|uniref:deleted in malignant brain tumors 1 protein n=1 Tax=Nematostella vectensis TaxID=45351 RepID=UPI0020771AB2|nr:deleted in malignant brain tumors 1 protein [Nematostella vectensis]